MSEGRTNYILVVDDNEMNRDVLARRLRRQNYTVDVAVDGEQAVEMLNTTQFHLVLLDLQMPKMNGYEVLEYIKNNEKLRDTPVIMITAVDDLDSVVRCIEMGADDYLFKPFNPVLLKARVSSSLEKGRRLNEKSAEYPPELKPVLTELVANTHHLASGNAGSLNAEQTRIAEHMIASIKRIANLLGIQES